MNLRTDARPKGSSFTDTSGMTQRTRYLIFATFTVLCGLSLFFLTRLQFSFDFEQFFPKGDPDLEFFQEFIENFETDDNFMLIAADNGEESVFDQEFLENFHAMTLAARELPYVTQSQSITKFSYPIKTPFGITTRPVIHIDQPERYARDSVRLMQDERFVYNLISPDARALVAILKTDDGLTLEQSDTLMVALTEMVDGYEFSNAHYLGRAYFQKELVAMQKTEILKSGAISSVLVLLILWYIFRRVRGILIAMVSIGVGMLLFFGFMGAMGRELTAMSALYPVLMIIVGTSDVVHIFTKYVDELRGGKDRFAAIRTTIREIGAAILLTSLTTAVGFLTLLTSRVDPIRDFGVNSAIGVVIAYFTVVTLTTALLSMFDVDQVMKIGRGQLFWERAMDWFYRFTRRRSRAIMVGAGVVLVLTFTGIAQIQTNYTIINNMPTGEKITEDFRYFEQKFTGFRPFEIAVFAGNGRKVTDFEVLRQVDSLENYLATIPQVRAVAGPTAIYKSINQAFQRNAVDAYRFPDSDATFRRYERFAEQVPQLSANILVSTDETKGRITGRMLDYGADNIKQMGLDVDAWIAGNLNSEVATYRRTGTGLIIDKNAEYIRTSLLLGLGLAVLIVSTLMAILFRKFRMLLVALIPNIFPLLLAGALLGYVGIELEAGVSIVFAVIFGIAVDDTIHFLSKYKLARGRGNDMEAALRITFRETGKAVVLTTIILFFGFLVMLFSKHPPSVTVGLLISLTLFSALFADLLLIPVLIRKFLGGEESTPPDQS